MPAPSKLEDTRDLLAAGLRPPARARHTWMGACLGFAALLWVAAVVTLIIALEGQVMGIVAGVIAIAAGTMTIITVMLAVAITIWRASTLEHKQQCDRIEELRRDNGKLAAQLEQLSSRVAAIDPWVIYSKIAGDMLGIKVDPGPLS